MNVVKRWAEVAPDAVYSRLEDGTTFRVRFIGSDVEVARYASGWRLLDAWKVTPERLGTILGETLP